MIKAEMSGDTEFPKNNDYSPKTPKLEPTNILALIMLLTNMLKFNDSASDMVVVSDVNREVMSPGQMKTGETFNHCNRK